MLHLIATLHLIGADARAGLARRLRTIEADRGSVTMEKVIWAGAVIVISAIVIGGITKFAQDKTDLLNK